MSARWWPPARWALFLAAVWIVFNGSALGRRTGYAALVEATALGRPCSSVSEIVLRLVGTPWVVLGVIAGACLVLWPRCRAGAVRCALACIALLGSSRALKLMLPLWSRGFFPFDNGMPSGHMTAFLAMLLAVGWAARPRGWRAAALSTAATTIVAFAVLSVTAHTVGDVLAALCLAGVCAETARPTPVRMIPTGRPLAIGGGAIIAALVLTGRAPASVVLALLLLAVGSWSWALWTGTIVSGRSELREPGGVHRS